MTCIVGIVKDSTVWMGADSAFTISKYMYGTLADSKLHRHGEFLIGSAGDYRLSNLLMEFEYPKPADDLADRFVRSKLVPSIRSQLKETDYYGDIEGSHEIAMPNNGQIIIGFTGSIYVITYDFAVCRFADYAAIGSATEAATIALELTRDMRDPRVRIEIVLEVLSHHYGGIMPPFTIVRTPEE